MAPIDQTLEKEHHERTKVKNIQVIELGRYEVRRAAALTLFAKLALYARPACIRCVCQAIGVLRELHLLEIIARLSTLHLAETLLGSL